MSEKKPEPFKFTIPKLEALKPSDKSYEVADTGQPGMSCRVLPTGVKTLQVHKRPKGSHKLARVKICEVGAFALDGEDGARSKARKILAKLEKGINPNEEDRQSRAKEQAKGITLQEALDDYLSPDRIAEAGKPVSKGMIKPRTAIGYRQRIEKHLVDWLKKPLADITPQMVINRHKAIAKTHYSAANNALRAFRRVYNHAAKQSALQVGVSQLPPNPTETMTEHWFIEKRRKNHIADGEIADWWQAIEKLPEHFHNGELARDYLQFVLLTGLRRREASGLLWEDVNLKAKTFRVTDTKNKDELELPLSDYLLELVERQLGKHETHVFPVKEVIKFYTKAGELSGKHFTVHDLRRSFVTIAEGLDIGLLTIKALVNHRLDENDVTGGYARIPTERMRKPMQEITDFILKSAGVKETKVVKLA